MLSVDKHKRTLQPSTLIKIKSEPGEEGGNEDPFHTNIELLSKFQIIDPKLSDNNDSTVKKKTTTSKRMEHRLVAKRRIDKSENNNGKERVEKRSRRSRVTRRTTESEAKKYNLKKSETQKFNEEGTYIEESFAPQVSNVASMVLMSSPDSTTENSDDVSAKVVKPPIEPCQSNIFQRGCVNYVRPQIRRFSSTDDVTCSKKPSILKRRRSAVCKMQPEILKESDSIAKEEQTISKEEGETTVTNKEENLIETAQDCIITNEEPQIKYENGHLEILSEDIQQIYDREEEITIVEEPFFPKLSNVASMVISPTMKKKKKKKTNCDVPQNTMNNESCNLQETCAGNKCPHPRFSLPDDLKSLQERPAPKRRLRNTYNRQLELLNVPYNETGEDEVFSKGEATIIKTSNERDLKNIETPTPTEDFMAMNQELEINYETFNVEKSENENIHAHDDVSYVEEPFFPKLSNVASMVLSPNIRKDIVEMTDKILNPPKELSRHSTPRPNQYYQQVNFDLSNISKNRRLVVFKTPSEIVNKFHAAEGKNPIRIRNENVEKVVRVPLLSLVDFFSRLMIFDEMHTDGWSVSGTSDFLQVMQTGLDVNSFPCILKSLFITKGGNIVVSGLGRILPRNHTILKEIKTKMVDSEGYLSLFYIMDLLKIIRGSKFCRNALRKNEPNCDILVKNGEKCLQCLLKDINTNSQFFRAVL